MGCQYIYNPGIQQRNWRWSNCVVWANEVISAVWRSNDAVSSLCSSRLHPLWQESRGSTLPLPNLSTNLSDNAQRLGSRSQRTGSKAILRRTGTQNHWQNSRGASQNSFSLACPGCWAVISQPTQDESLLLD